MNTSTGGTRVHVCSRYITLKVITKRRHISSIQMGNFFQITEVKMKRIIEFSNLLSLLLESSGQSSSDERKLSLQSKEIIPIITKELLEKQAKPRDKDRRRSTLEETEVQTKDPSESSNDEDRHSSQKNESDKQKEKEKKK